MAGSPNDDDDGAEAKEYANNTEEENTKGVIARVFSCQDVNPVWQTEQQN